MKTSTRLVDMCCAVISRNERLYAVDELKTVMPEELFHICFEL